MNNAFAHLIKPYAGWAALVCLVAATFGGLVAANLAFPLTCLLAAGALAAFRFWQPLNAFDFWSLDEWARMRFDALGVREWHAPHHAAGLYCSQVAVKTRDEAAAEMNTIMMELIRGRSGASASSATSFAVDPPESEKHRAARNVQYDTAQVRYNQCNAALSRELLEHLARGDLLAKGLPTRDDVAQSERVIPTSRWRIMTVDVAKAQASGLGWHYTGIVVGKKPRIQTRVLPAIPVKAPPHLSAGGLAQRQERPSLSDH